MLSPTSSEECLPYFNVLAAKKGLMSSFNLQKMFSLDIFFTNQLDFTKTVIPLALIAYESRAHSVFGLMGYNLTHSPFRLKE